MRTAPPARAGCCGHVQNAEEVLDAEHAIYRLALVDSRYVTGLAHSALHEKQFITFMQNLLYGYNQWTVIFDSSFVDGFYTELQMNLSFCAVYCVLMRQHSQGVE
jgi:hypothetical protein